MKDSRYTRLMRSLSMFNVIVGAAMTVSGFAAALLCAICGMPLFVTICAAALGVSCYTLMLKSAVEDYAEFVNL